MATATKTASTPAVKVGTTFRKAYADGMPLWEVIRIEGKFAYIQVINEPIEHEGVLIDSDWVGTTDTTSLAQIRRTLTQEASMRKHFDAEAQWWDTQPDGTELHYHDSFGRFMRGTVTRRNGTPELLCTALVGTWNKRDIVTTRYDGTPNYGYHAKKVMEGKSWTPSASCMFEKDPSRYAQYGDPRTMEPLTIAPPAITPEEAEHHHYNRIVQEVQDVLNDYTTASKDRLAAVKTILDRP